METKLVPESELNNPLNASKTKLPLLPEFEMMEAKIVEVTYQFAMFEGKQAYVKDESGENKLDRNGNPIPKKEFAIKFALKDFQLPNGESRHCWLRVGASWTEKSKLKKLMSVLGFELVSITPKIIIDALTDVQVKFQLVNKTSSNGNVYQNINFDSIRLVKKPENKVLTPDDIEWKD